MYQVNSILSYSYKLLLYITICVTLTPCIEGAAWAYKGPAWGEGGEGGIYLSAKPLTWGSFDRYTLASFPGLSRFYVRLVHAKHEREEKFEKRERPGTISHVR